MWRCVEHSPWRCPVRVGEEGMHVMRSGILEDTLWTEEVPGLEEVKEDLREGDSWAESWRVKEGQASGCILGFRLGKLMNHGAVNQDREWMKEDSFLGADKDFGFGISPWNCCSGFDHNVVELMGTGFHFSWTRFLSWPYHVLMVHLGKFLSLSELWLSHS